MTKRLLFTFASLLVSVQLFAADIVTGGFFYNYLNGYTGTEVEVASPTYQQSGYVGDVTIPRAIEFNGRPYTVVHVGDGAYADNTNLTSVVLPATIKEIGDNAFKGCVNMTQIDIPAISVEMIGDNAFRGCTSLSEIILPWSLKSVGVMAFYGCSALDKVTLGGVESIQDNAFNFCKLSSIIIPETVTTIGRGAFGECNLRVVSIPHSVTSIGDGAFMMNNRLRVITLGKGLTSIGDNAFYAFPDAIENVTQVISYIEDPMVVTDLVKNPGEATLIVPKGTADKYWATAGWNAFSSIVEGVEVKADSGNTGDMNNDGTIDGTDVSVLLEKVLSGD